MKTANSWPFNLTRFDTDPDNADTDGDHDPNDTPTGPDEESSPADQLAAARAEADKWRQLARKHEDRAKANAAKARKLDDLEAETASELEKATARAENAEQQAQTLLIRAVTAEVKALAAAMWAEPADAPLYLDLPAYISDDNDIDTETIAVDLAKVLETKPHLAKPDPKRKPKPDVSQGPQPGTNADFTTASKESFAAELGRYGLRTRS